MFAVLKTGGKQYKVTENDMVTVERLAAAPGETVQFNDVLMLGGESPMLGTPLVDGAAVQAEVVEQGRGPKVLNLKRRRRKHGSRRLKGHRQYLTTVRITGILAEGAGESGVKAAIGTGSAPAAEAAAPVKKKPKAKAPAASEAPAEEAQAEAAAPAKKKKPAKAAAAKAAPAKSAPKKASKAKPAAAKTRKPKPDTDAE